MQMPEDTKANIALRRKTGRPSKLTPDVQQTIVSAVRVGNYLETASALAGINVDTIRDWLKQGARASRGKYKDFSVAVKKAIAEAEARDVAIIDKAADGWDKISQRVTKKRNEKGELEVIEQTAEQTREFAWTAAAWRLERKFPHKWGRHDRVEISGDAENPVVIQQPKDMYSGANIVAWMMALADVKLIPSEVLQLIDVTPTNEPNGNGSKP